MNIPDCILLNKILPYLDRKDLYNFIYVNNNIYNLIIKNNILEDYNSLYLVGILEESKLIRHLFIGSCCKDIVESIDMFYGFFDNISKYTRTYIYLKIKLGEIFNFNCDIATPYSICNYKDLKDIKSTKIGDVNKLYHVNFLTWNKYNRAFYAISAKPDSFDIMKYIPFTQRELSIHKIYKKRITNGYYYF